MIQDMELLSGDLKVDHFNDKRKDFLVFPIG